MLLLLRGRASLPLLISIVALSTGLARGSVVPSDVDVWFSTSTPTISLSLSHGIRLLSPGDILSAKTGNVVYTNRQLIDSFQPRLGLFAGNRGLDGFSIIGDPGDPTIAFSVYRGFYSKSLGRNIGEGDLVTNRGELVATNRELVSAFDPKGSNFGLDAVFVNSLGGESGPDVWFSTRKSFYSNALGKTIQPGDILSNHGQIVARASDLLGAFQPRGNADTMGIDSLYVRQEGDNQVYWFSTNKDFYSQSLNRWIRSTDLLASDGTRLMTENDFKSKYGFAIPICGRFELDAAALAIPNVPPNPPPKPPPPVPEPATLSLLLMAGLAGLARRRR